MSHGSRRRKQAAQGFIHLARLGRPVYKAKASSTIGDAIERNREAARLEARRKAKRKTHK